MHLSEEMNVLLPVDVLFLMEGEDVLAFVGQILILLMSISQLYPSPTFSKGITMEQMLNLIPIHVSKKKKIPLV